MNAMVEVIILSMIARYIGDGVTVNIPLDPDHNTTVIADMVGHIGQIKRLNSFAT